MRLAVLRDLVTELTVTDVDAAAVHEITCGHGLLLVVQDESVGAAEDAVEEDGEIIVYTDLKDLASVRSALVDRGVKVKDAELRYIANTPVEIADPEVAQKLFKVLDALDDLDDVVNVHTNADITADIE